MLVLLENNLNVLKGRIFKCVFKGYYMLLLLLFFNFSQHIMTERLSPE